MKKFLILTIFGLLLLPSCTAKEELASLFGDAKDSYDNIVTEGKEVIDEFNETKDKIGETVEDLEEAVNSVRDAIDAIQSIGGEEERDSEETEDTEEN